MIMKMKRTAALLMATMTVLVAGAQTKKDTTIVFNGQRIVVSGNAADTQVEVYNAQGTQLRKSSTTTYVDGQEVERVYVTSPFLPSSYTNGAGVFPTLPTVWYAFTSTDNKIGSTANSSAGLHTRGSGSGEVGVTVFEGICPLTPTGRKGSLGLSMGTQVYMSWNNFQTGVLLEGQGNHVSFAQSAAKAATNRITYTGIRVPLMLVWNPLETEGTMASQIFLGLSADIRVGGKYRFTPEETGDPVERNFRVNPVGLNAEMGVNFGPLTITSRVGLLPLFKTTDGKKAYTSSVGIGINIGQLFRKGK